MTHPNKIPFKAFVPIVIVFVLVTCVALLAKDMRGINPSVLLGGNLLLFLVTLFSWIFHRKALNAGNTHAFLRNTYSAMLLKLFVCIIAAFVYISYAGKLVNKPALFAVMFLYLVYTFMEIGILMKYSKRSNNA